MIKLKSIYEIKLSGYQIDIIESAIENTTQSKFFNAKDTKIAESLLIDLKEQPIEKTLEGELMLVFKRRGIKVKTLTVENGASKYTIKVER